MSAAAADCSPLDYDAALDMLSSLMVWRKGDTFDLMFDYLKILELDGPISDLKVIHVAGTKGKGSTCAFAESILRNCGFHTGLLTSPHLIEVRERICLNGVKVSKDKFSSYLLWCWNRLKEKTGDIPMPNFFHFLTLLALKIFTAEKVDVAVLEVGLGGRLDSTNVFQQPIVCGISSLGYDHMEILGHTLAKIAEEKAGIFKKGVPAFTVAQPDEAMYVLEDRASQLSVPLQVSQPLDASLLNGSTLGLDGDHQYLNAGLAVALCRTWLEKTGHSKYIQLNQASLPVEFLRGLATAKLQGRAQVVVDPLTSMVGTGGLVFFLDGAHTPESMEVCAKWFCGAVKKDLRQHAFSNNLHYHGKSTDIIQNGFINEVPENDSMQILLFNCTKERDPMVLFPPLVDICSKYGIYLKKGIFVPSVPAFNKVRTNSVLGHDTNVVDLSWQRTIQQAWQKVPHGDKVTCAKVGENSHVFQSLSLALEWLREIASNNQSTRLHVLVTGSLALVGDLLDVLYK